MLGWGSERIAPQRNNEIQHQSPQQATWRESEEAATSFVRNLQLPPPNVALLKAVLLIGVPVVVDDVVVVAVVHSAYSDDEEV